MRSKDQETAKARCLDAIPRVLEAAGQPRSDDVRQDDEGWVNPCYFVGRDLVVRFNARDPEQPKFRREELAFSLLSERGLPVPTVVHRQPAGDVTPYEALVVTRLPGRSLERSWPALAEAHREALAAAAGRLLADVHETTLDGFGELANEPEERRPTWREHVVESFGAEARAAVACGALGARDAERAVAAAASRADCLDGVRAASLVHRDFHFGNLLVEDGRITGALDFEWSLAGDPELDLVIESAVRTVAGEWTEVFLAAYREQRPPSGGWPAKRELYALWHDVTICRVARLHFSAEEARDFRDATLRLLERLDGGD